MSNAMNTVEFFARWRPDAVALQCRDELVCWRELDDETGRVAAGLARHGVVPGDRVGIVGENSLRYVLALFGILRAGAVVVPINNKLVASEISYIAKNSGLQFVFRDTAHRELIAASLRGLDRVRTVALDDGPADHEWGPLRADPEPLFVDRAPTDIAFIAYTSGTSGFPKGVILTHGNLSASAYQWRTFENWSYSVSMLLTVPMAFTGSLVNYLLNPLSAGGRVVLEPKYDAARVLELITTGEVTAILAVPQIFEGMTQLPEFEQADLSSLDTAMAGGAPVPASLIKTYEAKGVRIRQTYALTESTGSGTNLPSALAFERPDSAGVAGVGAQVRVVDELGEDQPTDTLGEILIKGPQVTPGYWQNPEATAERITDGWLRTGDMGCLDKNGLLEVIDRKHGTIISGGANVYPAEIERAVSGFPGVTEVAAYGVPHEKWGQTVALSVRGDIDTATLHALCVENLAKYKVPRYVVRTDRPLPRTMSGKVLRRVLADEFIPGAAYRTAAP